jgi:hypothetical protein
MLKKAYFEVNCNGEWWCVEFELEPKGYITIEPYGCGDYGDENFRRFGVVSGAYIRQYLIFRLTDIYKNTMYLVIDINFWDTDYTDEQIEFEFAGRKITVKAKLPDFRYYLMNEDELNRYYESMDE